MLLLRGRGGVLVLMRMIFLFGCFVLLRGCTRFKRRHSAMPPSAHIPPHGAPLMLPCSPVLVGRHVSEPATHA